LQIWQPLPPHMKHSTSISPLGSVKGKYDGRSRVRALLPYNWRANSVSVPFRSPRVMFLPTASSSIWLNCVSERALTCS